MALWACVSSDDAVIGIYLRTYCYIQIQVGRWDYRLAHINRKKWDKGDKVNLIKVPYAWQGGLHSPFNSMMYVIPSDT